MEPKDKAIVTLLICLMIGLFFFAKQPVYICSEEQKPLVQESLQACFEEETKKEQIKYQEKIQLEELNLQTLKEKNRQCEVKMKEGKICEKEIAFNEMVLKNKTSCADEVKAALCEPRMFLWKIWYW